MQLKLDKDGFVIGYAIIGGISGGVDYYGDTPTDFKANYVAYQLIDGQLIYSADKRAELDRVEAVIEELPALMEWFDDYDLQVNKWMRSQRIMQPRDDINIDALDAEAEIKRARINEIRKVLGG
jgi:hypothetical protein